MRRTVDPSVAALINGFFHAFEIESTEFFHSFRNDGTVGCRRLPEVNYGDQQLLEIIQASGTRVEMDVTGLQCPAPVDALKEKLETLNVGDMSLISVTDPLFVSHLPTWCCTYGHQLLKVQDHGSTIQVLVRKGISPMPSITVSRISPKMGQR